MIMDDIYSNLILNLIRKSEECLRWDLGQNKTHLEVPYLLFISLSVPQSVCVNALAKEAIRLSTFSSFECTFSVSKSRAKQQVGGGFPLYEVILGGISDWLVCHGQYKLENDKKQDCIIFFVHAEWRVI